MEGSFHFTASANRRAGTLPPQPPRRRSPVAQRLGAGVLVSALAALGAAAVLRLAAKPSAERAPPAHDIAAASRRLGGAASILSFSVLADSALEHYRGTFHNPAMYAAPLVAAASLANSLAIVANPARVDRGRVALCGLALATGTAGTGFHLYNVTKREGGIGFLNLFYGAPLGAPAAIALAGLAGLAGVRLAIENRPAAGATLLGLPAGRVMAAGATVGLFGTAAEAALLHFRGAFHDPFMYAPVTLPPLAGAALAAAAVKRQLLGSARWLLRATMLLGVAGVGFHAYGVQRNMGGFYNWSQNLLQGPPLPAPPAFTGLALAGLAAVSLMEAE